MPASLPKHIVWVATCIALEQGLLFSVLYTFYLERNGIFTLCCGADLVSTKQIGWVRGCLIMKLYCRLFINWIALLNYIFLMPTVVWPKRIDNCSGCYKHPYPLDDPFIKWNWPFFFLFRILTVNRIISKLLAFKEELDKDVLNCPFSWLLVLMGHLLQLISLKWILSALISIKHTREGEFLWKSFQLQTWVACTKYLIPDNRHWGHFKIQTKQSKTPQKIRRRVLTFLEMSLLNPQLPVS